MSLERQYQQLQQSDPSDAFEEEIDDDDYDQLTIVDQYVNSSYVQDVKRGSVESATSLSRCAVCQDAASGVHYCVPACAGCKSFFGRVVSSRNIRGACAHSVPLEMTPQSRNSCQWCRLKKCCAVNMARKRSKLGRQAKLRTRGASAAASAASSSAAVSAADQQILLPGTQKAHDFAASVGAAYCRASDVSDQHLLAYIEQTRRDFESQISRRSCFRKAQPQPQPPQQPPPTTPPSLFEGRLSGRRVASQLVQQPGGSGSGSGSFAYPSPPEPVKPPTPPPTPPPPPPLPLYRQQYQQQQQQQQQSVNCLRLISRGHTAWQSSMPDCSSSVAPGPAAAVAKDHSPDHAGCTHEQILKTQSARQKNC